VRAARLSVIKADIAANLSDCDLKAATVAARQGVTPRYVHKLFESEGTSFSEFVLSQRLGRAYRIFSDPRFFDRLISSIAFETGFGDLSHFNHCFRRRYGVTPSDVRAQAKLITQIGLQ
jgi:AraC-like DNA-binding protein